MKVNAFCLASPEAVVASNLFSLSPKSKLYYVLLSILGRECFNNFIYSRLKLGERKCLLKIGQRRWVLSHGLIVLSTTPLGIHGDLGAVRTSMKTG